MNTECLTLKVGDLLKSKEQYIVHQTNCVGTKPAGLSKSMFGKYKYADIYTPREESKRKSTPGTISVKGTGKKLRYVINLNGQRYPGRSHYKNDSAKLRLQWFENGLQRIKKIKGIKSIAFPYGIGCGLGGGKWIDYRRHIRNFAKTSSIKVVIYRRSDQGVLLPDESEGDFESEEEVEKEVSLIKETVLLTALEESTLLVLILKYMIRRIEQFNG